MSNQDPLKNRRTFAIISHPDAGKTTITEKLLLFSGAIQLAGTVKGKKNSRHATSDWMELEKQRGISVTTSVMQFHYRDTVFNLLDTPGHSDFSEDTYRTLTAVDSALMVIDAAKGVEDRTIKLLEICRMRNIPIITFINKMDRETRDPIELLDEIESVLNIQCSAMTWPIGMGKEFKGVYHLINNTTHLYQAGLNYEKQDGEIIPDLNSTVLDEKLGSKAAELRDDIELVEGASHEFDRDAFLAGQQTPVFFGSAINNFGVRELLDAFVDYAPPIQGRATTTRHVEPDENKFTGFVFKIQANMDPAHRDRIAFLRICSGKYQTGIKALHVGTGKTTKIANAHTFMAGEREHAEEAYAGDIIGIHNYGTIQIGDTFTQGEELKFVGIPNFAPELFKIVRLKDPLKSKALEKGLKQLSEEGATQVFKYLSRNDLILGAVGVLQFDVVAHRLKAEYNVECVFENVNVSTARWVSSDDKKAMEALKSKASEYLALDNGDNLTYLAPSNVNLSLAQERHPDVEFMATREH